MTIFWDRDRELLLRTMWLTHSTRAMMAAIGTDSRGAIIGKGRRLGLPARKKAILDHRPRKPKAKGTSLAPSLMFTQRIDVPLQDVQPVICPPGGGVHILDLDNNFNMCRVVVDPVKLMFCGLPTVYDTSWCAGCFRIMTQRQTGVSIRYKTWRPARA